MESKISFLEYFVFNVHELSCKKNDKDLLKSCFLFACKDGFQNVIQKLIESGLPNWKTFQDENGYFGFQIACANGHENVVKYLLNHGFVANTADVDGYTGFHHSCSNGHENIVKYLLDQNFNINNTNIYGYTGFHYACSNGHENIAKYLIDQGFDFNTYDNSGDTGYHLACEEGHENIVEYLIDHGFDMNSTDVDGYTGFHSACSNGRQNIVKYLIDQGFDVNTADVDGRTGFYFACSNNHEITLSFNNNCNLNTLTNEDGSSGIGLALASRAVHYDLVVLLLEFGANYDLQSISHETREAVRNRIFEIEQISQALHLKFTNRIEQLILNFTIRKFTNAGLKNLKNIEKTF